MCIFRYHLSLIYISVQWDQTQIWSLWPILAHYIYIFFVNMNRELNLGYYSPPYLYESDIWYYCINLLIFNIFLCLHISVLYTHTGYWHSTTLQPFSWLVNLSWAVAGVDSTSDIVCSVGSPEYFCFHFEHNIGNIDQHLVNFMLNTFIIT